MKCVTAILCAGLVVLEVVDWIYPSNPLLGQRSERLIPHAIRAMMLLIMLSYVIYSSITVGYHGFAVGRAILLYAVIVGVSILWSPHDPYYSLFQFAKYLYWITAAFAFYHLSLSGMLQLRHITLTITFIVMVAATRSLIVTLDPSTPIVRNAQQGVLLWCIPLLLLNRRAKTATALIWLASFAVVLTLKRGTLVALIFSSFAYFLLFSRIAGKCHYAKKQFIMIFIIFLIVGGVLASQWQNVLVRWSDITDIDKLGSGRGTWFHMILNHWYNGSIPNQFFGFGFYSVTTFLGHWWDSDIYAHNDWLETIHDQGLVGLVAFIALYGTLFSLILKGARGRNEVTPPLIMGYTIFLCTSFYAQNTTESHTIFFAFLLGYCAAAINRNQLSTVND